jgi:hypothetical protein
MLARTVGASHERRIDAMHVQIVNFQLNGLDEAQYRAACEEEAPAFALIPGLLSKIWLADESTNTYGGVYIWRDHNAMEAFVSGDLFRSFTVDPQVSNFMSRDFRVLEAPTSITNGLATARV